MKWKTCVDIVYSMNPECLYTRADDGWELVTVIESCGRFCFYWKKQVI